MKEFALAVIVCALLAAYSIGCSSASEVDPEPCGVDAGSDVELPDALEQSEASTPQP